MGRISLVSKAAVVIAAGLALAASSRISAQAPDPLADLADFAESIRAAWRAPGMAVAVVHDGSIVFAHGFGRRDVRRQLEVTPQTVFPVGSTTKTFTAMSVALLADEGKLDLDEPLIDRVPNFRLHDDHATLHTTARDLLCHRTGLPGHYDLLWLTTPMSRQEMFARLRYVEPSAGFRARFQYSNLGFATLGVVVEHLSGERWEDFVRRRILEPLGMARSGFVLPEDPAAANWALPHRIAEGEAVSLPFQESVAFRNVALIGPAGSLASSAEDLARWVLLHLAGGRLGDERLISEALVREMHSPQKVIRDPGYRALARADSYALGWAVADHRGHRTVHHGGNIEGFSAVVSLMPEIDAGVVVLSNSMNLLGYAISGHVFDRLLGLEPVARNADLMTLYGSLEQALESSRTQPAPDPGASPMMPLESYAGEYSHPVFGALEVVPAADGLRLELASGVQAPLRHVRFNVFKGATSEFYLPVIETRFRLGDEGEIDRVAVVLQPGSEEVVFRRSPRPSD
jgi:CubicO group peptidase (beta-lactamase class C family)